MSAGFVAFVVGAAIPVAVAEIGPMRRALAARSPEPGAGLDPMDVGAPDWEATMPAPRTALRPRWESSSDPADEDDLAEFLVTVVVAVLVVGGLLLTSSSLPRVVMFLLTGLVLSLIGTAVFAALRRRHLPPRWRQVLARGTIVWVICAAALLWFTTTRFRGLWFDRVHGGIISFPLGQRPGQVHRSFEGDGVLFYAVLGFGLLLAVGLLISVVIDVGALFAATRLGEGSRRVNDAWLAQLYPRRQLRVWISTIGVAVIAFLLVNGSALKWYDDLRAKSEVNPSQERPIVFTPAPPTTVTTPTTGAPVEETTTTIPSSPVTPPPETVAPAAP